MEPLLKIEAYSVHLWQVFVPDLLAQLPDFTLLLHENEMERARRFRFDPHRQRFIIAHGVLRRILSFYTAISPEHIDFTLGPRGKPYLKYNTSDLQFNVSHSHDMVVYAITQQAEIGIDIEKIEPDFNEEVAKRFFSEKEYAELMRLPESERIPVFYRLWSGKEAIIKALGEGLYVPLSDFSLDLIKKVQTIALMHEGKRYSYHLENFLAKADYQSAFATAEPVKHVVHYDYARF